MSAIINVVLGSLLKMLSAGVSKAMENSHLRMMASINAPVEKVIKLQSGEDHADNFTKYTRRLLALILVTLWSFVVVWFSIHNHITVRYMVPKVMSGFWHFILPFPVTESGIMEVSVLSMVIVSTINVTEFIAGFYFTKFGK